MKMIRGFLLLAFFASFSAQLSAQGIIADPTKWSYESKKLDSNHYDLIFHCTIDGADWHIYSQDPGGDGSLPAPTFTFNANPSVKTIGKLKEKGKLIIDKANMDVVGIMKYYKKTVDFVQRVEVSANTTFTGSHKYTICNEHQCLNAITKKFSFSINGLTATTSTDATQSVAKQALSPDSLKTAGDIPATATQTGAPAKAGAKGGIAKAPKNHSTALLFFTGLGNGLVSVITPCVFAMLPMTVSFFLKRSKDRKTGVRIALQYALSIVLIFTVIGGVLSILFGPDALHAFSTNWIVNLFFFAIFLIFGISFLGAFEINLPSSWSTKLDSKANTQNFLGIFFMALTLVVVSFSCTGAFIGNLLGVMALGGKTGPLVGFLGYGIGLALPFALFAIFPTLLNELGKSGGWLNAVKVTFGFIELALAMKFLSNADLTMHWRLLDREIFLGIWVALAFALGLYLLGVIRFSHDSELPKNDWGLPYLKVPRLLFGLTALIFGMYLLPGMWGAPLRGMGAFVPPMGTQDFVLSAGGGAAPGGASGDGTTRKYADIMKIYEPATVVNFGLEVYYDYDEALAASKKAGKPLMLDFTGINCVNCRKFESEVWSNAEVMQRMKNDFVIASLFTDASAVDIPKAEQYHSSAIQKQVETLGEKCVDLQISKFNSNTQPYYFFVDDKGTLLADEGVSYPTAPSSFVAHLDKVKARYKELHP